MMDPEARILDYLIINSGVFGRWILRLARRLRFWQVRLKGEGGRRRYMRKAAGAVVWTISLVFTYYVGGSLTRNDQHTLARLRGMPEGRAYRLTLMNALCCGLPCAAGYFLLGEGFRLVSGLHSWVELPSLLASHFSLAMGAASLLVDIFRAADAGINHRCWAPLGIFPLILNLPTYLKTRLDTWRAVRPVCSEASGGGQPGLERVSGRLPGVRTKGG